MYKEFYGEDREWALWKIGGGRSGGGGHGRDTGKERVGDGSFLKSGNFFPCFLVHDFFLLLFLCINPFFP